jgi:hypothetical protein
MRNSPQNFNQYDHHLNRLSPSTPSSLTFWPLASISSHINYYHQLIINMSSSNNSVASLTTAENVEVFSCDTARIPIHAPRPRREFVMSDLTDDLEEVK